MKIESKALVFNTNIIDTEPITLKQAKDILYEAQLLGKFFLKTKQASRRSRLYFYRKLRLKNEYKIKKPSRNGRAFCCVQGALWLNSCFSQGLKMHFITFISKVVL